MSGYSLCVCLVRLFPNELSCSDIEIHKMFKAGQSVQLVVAFVMKFGQCQKGDLSEPHCFYLFANRVNLIFLRLSSHFFSQVIILEISPVMQNGQIYAQKFGR